MDIYIARQPIFNKDMSIFGYELLHRRNSANYYESEDNSGATAELVRNSFLVLDFDNLTDGTRGFINFTQDLLEAEIPHILPKEKVVVEVLETVEATDIVIEVCKKLKKEGYILALDDLILDRTDRDYTPLIELADIIKIEFPSADKQKQRELLKKYKNKVIFLAEKVETREEFKEAVEMGYSLFQGYFFCEPMMLKSKEIASLNIHLIEILKELQKTEPNFFKITETIEKDLGLTFKLLKMANSIYYGAKCEITSLQQAVVRLGIHEMKRWISILLIKDFENDENSELIKVSLLRGKLLSLMARELKRTLLETDFFFTGVLSSIDIIMDQDMGAILQELAISEDVKKALLGEKGSLRDCLDTVLLYERLEFDQARVKLSDMSIDLGRFTELYIEALKWQRTAV
ncbi:MAG TPA: HDOD domain-containing protein [Anaerovoracaceae bacterium]|nr:HDOD domain-containing protein [Anaerovoracaceae bacterium]